MWACYIMPCVSWVSVWECVCACVCLKFPLVCWLLIDDPSPSWKTGYRPNKSLNCIHVSLTTSRLILMSRSAAEFYRSVATFVFLEYFCLHLCELSWLEMFLYHFSLPETNSDTWALGIVRYRVPVQYGERKFIFQLYIPLTLHGYDMISIIVIWPCLGETLKREIATQHSFIYFDSQSLLKKSKWPRIKIFFCLHHRVLSSKCWGIYGFHQCADSAKAWGTCRRSKC